MVNGLSSARPPPSQYFGVGHKDIKQSSAIQKGGAGSVQWTTSADRGVGERFREKVSDQ